MRLNSWLSPAILAALLAVTACDRAPDPLAPPMGTERFGVSAAVWTQSGAVPDAVFGYDVDGAGDVNGDGYEDIVVGAPLMSPGGAAFLYLGSPSGPATIASWSAGGTCSFGQSVEGLGDVNGDGYADFAIGDTCGQNTGTVHVWYGQAAIGGLSSTAPLVLTNGVAQSRFGEGLGAAGDTNGDGYADLVVGAPGWSLGGGAEGQAMLYLGSASGVVPAPLWSMTGTQAGGELGGGVAGAGDVDGDGRDDVLIASPKFDTPVSNAGRVQLFGGTTSGSPSVLWTFNGSQSGTEVGHILGGVGDVDGDGYADFAVATSSWTNQTAGEGRVWLYTAPGGNVTLTPRTWTGTVAFGGLGAAVAGAGDVNGDGYADVLVGASGMSTAYVYLGGPGGAAFSPAFSTTGVPGEGLGGAGSGAGDVNGDGLGDIVIAAPFAGASDDGAAQVHLGQRSLPSVSPAATLDGASPGDQLGADVAVGDVNGDGFADVLAGAHGHDGTFVDEGRANLSLGGPSGTVGASVWSDFGGQAGAALGGAVDCGGDVNGDGYGDWVVGARSYDAPGLANAGQVRVYLGGPGALPASPSATLTGTVANALLGSDVALGDLNGDGFADVIAGARLFTSGQSNEGAVFVWFGSASGVQDPPSWTYEGNVPGAQTGTAVAFAGDTDGNGFGDLAVGAPGFSGGPGSGGAVHLFPGGVGGPGAAPSFAVTGTGVGGLSQLGAAVAGAGDVDGDGLDDLLVGAPLSVQSFTNEGAVALFRGRATAAGVETSPGWVRYGGALSAGLGTGVSTAGDLDGDGLAELFVGATGLGAGGTAQLFRGVAGGVPSFASAQDYTATQAGQQLGAALGAGDVNGDGIPDLVAGAALFDTTVNGTEGRVIVWRGNSGDGAASHPAPAALQVDDGGQPLAPWGRLSSPVAVEVMTTSARSPFGSLGVLVELEAKPLGVAFNGSGTTTALGSSVYSARSPLGGATLATATGLTADTAIHWRARLRYDPSGAPPQAWGPWMLGGRPGQSAGVHARTACGADLDGDGVCDPVDDDDDGDGVAALADGGLDCDDTDATVFPGAVELCDAIDSDCDGDVVEGDLDTDGDLLPDCVDDDDDDDGTDDALDCAPLDPLIHPGAAEACDGLDTDCDGVVPADEADEDGDGVRICAQDCDDTDADTFPGAPERLDCLDNDCDGVVPAAETANADLDGYAACVDCDDDRPTVSPDSPELCDGLDTNCDGTLDADGLSTGELDDDGDGYPECAGDCDDAQANQYPGAPETLDATEDLNCDGTFGLADADGDGVSVADAAPDCDDSDPARFPGNPEVCDGVDNDCDGVIPPGELGDGDGDGFLSCEDCDDAEADVHPGVTEICDGFDTNCDGYVGPGDYDEDGDGWAPCGGDCDDTDDATHPGQSEDLGCLNGVDNDCDGSVDVPQDVDGDGSTTCEGDCADDDSSIRPGVPDDQCDGVDDNCDGVADEMADADGDGSPRCGEGPDCDDSDPSVHPGAPELCDDVIDNDCDSSTLPFIDGDGDGRAGCPQGDCDDHNAAVFPGNPEACDGLDNDCNGGVDDGLDADGDGLLACDGDCAEGEPTARAGLPELCDDGLDNDCDRDVDEDCDGGPTGLPLDVVFPAGCVCDADGPARPAATLLLIVPMLTGVRRRRARL